MVTGQPTADDLARESYWHRTFAELHAQPPEHLDYASAAEQAYTFAACLLACGSVDAITCLDAGCGKGGFARMLHAAGASSVVGLDYIDETIQALRRTDPHIRWESGSVSDAAAVGGLGVFARVFAIEILQCVSAAAMFENLWSAVAPNGRLIGVTPNADNPFVRRRADERPGLYAPLGCAAIIEHMRALPDVAQLGVMGFVWREDRSIVLYDLLPLTSNPQWEEPPKRLLFLARKAGDRPR